MTSDTQPRPVQAELPTHPNLLRCRECDQPWSEHAADGSVGHVFARPHLPFGYCYVDELSAGTRFAFLIGRGSGPTRTAVRIERCVADRLLRIDSSSHDFPATTRWLRDSTVVRLAR